MAIEIILKLKKRIAIMRMVIGALVVLLAASSAYNFYLAKNYTFERETGYYYTVPEKQQALYIPQPDKRRKKVK